MNEIEGAGEKAVVLEVDRSELPNMAELFASGYFHEVDYYFALAIERMNREKLPGRVLLAIALVSRVVRYGHACLEITRFASTLPVDEEGVVHGAACWPDAASWSDELANRGVIDSTGAGQDRPLVFRENRLYLRRMYYYEQTVLRQLVFRAEIWTRGVDEFELQKIVDYLYPRDKGVNWQKLATVLAARRQLTVITGGPGTGKTTTVVKILVTLVRMARAAAMRPPVIVMSAPTGKAAARLSEAVQRALLTLGLEETDLRCIPREAWTLHRILGARADGSHFAYDREHPLAADVVVVDETSMVDLPMMARLLDALLESSRLILLGDADQLASVEAGTVLGDICALDPAAGYSTRAASCFEQFCPEGTYHTSASKVPLRDSIIRLTRSYRFSEGGGISELAAGIRDGEIERVEAILTGRLRDDIRFVEVDTENHETLSRLVRGDVHAGFRGLFEAESDEDLLAVLSTFRILCVHRRGSGGVIGLNELCERLLSRLGYRSAAGGSYEGRPVMVLRNDYHLGLFNGDVGVTRWRGASPRVIFRDAAGEIRAVVPARLPEHETVFAMSVHKSQGSEFDHVMLVLPSKISPILTRELLYTAITRAKKKVTVVGRFGVWQEGMKRQLSRAGGLRKGLWGTGKEGDSEGSVA